MHGKNPYEYGPVDVVDGKGKMKGRGKGKKKSEPEEERDKGKSKGGGGPAASARDKQIDDLIETFCDDENLALEKEDFDFRSRRFLHELMSRDGDGGEDRVKNALMTCADVARTKERDDVDNWKAYVFKLVRKEDPQLYDELKERDIRRRRQEG